jgi:hypothetical protein
MRRNTRHKSWGLGLALTLVTLVTGCGGNNALLPVQSPPAPRAGQTAGDWFSVETPNYYTLYTGATIPFDPSIQFVDAHYPLPIAYLQGVPSPTGFTLTTETETAMRAWAHADPRVTAVSGTPPASARITCELVESITYGNIQNIIGLTIYSPDNQLLRYRILIATRDPISGSAMPAVELARTLTHELGHALGLGHSPEARDLMHYRANTAQGATRPTFLTLGDALTLWSTLSARQINWIATRPTISYPAQASVYPLARTRAQIAPDAAVVCIYTRP